MKYRKIIVPILAATLFAAPALAGAGKGYGKKVAATSKTTQVSAETGRKYPIASVHHGDDSGHLGDTTNHQRGHADHDKHHYNQRRQS